MANTNQGIMVKKDWVQPLHTDWLLANPWFWLAAGGAGAIWSLLWTFARGADASDNRIIVLAVALLLGGVGLWMRWRDRQTVFLIAWQAPIALVLGCVFALVFLGVTAVFLASFFVEDSVGLKTAPIFLVWLSFAPASFFAARRCLNRNSELSTATLPASHPIREDAAVAEEEIGFAFVVMAAVCVIGSFTLYADPATPTDWDTLRMFLRVCTAASLAAAVLTLITTALRRLVLSFLIMIHFTGICTAALSAPPAPWIVQQAWMRLFRPYLEFAYLNNAYHFYAPDPGPSSYLWFRIIYEGPAGAEEGEWFKVPQLDDAGHIRHPVALDYQRFLSLTEAVMHPDPLPNQYYYDYNTKQWEPNRFYTDRVNLVPVPNEVVIGKAKPKHPRIKMHPDIPPLMQVKVPNDGCRRLLSSFARFVGDKHAVHPEKPDWKFKSVKIYEVVHWIAPVQWFLYEIPPTDPVLYRPYYVGNFDANGQRIDDKDPYLYWLLPSIRDNENDIKSQVRDYARLHAGDPNWIRRGSDKQWVASGQEDRR